jgi:hypothetical protein
MAFTAPPGVLEAFDYIQGVSAAILANVAARTFSQG